MRNFWLNRLEDESGVSGIGHVAQGTEFDNGRVALSWAKSFGFYDSIQDVKDIHGHGGRTIVEFLPDTDDFMREIQMLQDDVVSIAGDLADRDKELGQLEREYEDMKFRMDGLDK